MPNAEIGADACPSRKYISPESSADQYSSAQITPLTTMNTLPGNVGEDDLAVLTVRNLLYDICNQNGGGHGGSAIGMAAIGVALWKYVMRYNPSNPEWFDRDRFVLSLSLIHI